MVVERGECPVQEEIVYGDYCVVIKRFKKARKRELIIGRIGKSASRTGCRLGIGEGKFDGLESLFGCMRKVSTGEYEIFIGGEGEETKRKVKAVFLSRYSLIVWRWG